MTAVGPRAGQAGGRPRRLRGAESGRLASPCDFVVGARLPGALRAEAAPPPPKTRRMRRRSAELIPLDRPRSPSPDHGAGTPATGWA